MTTDYAVVLTFPGDIAESLSRLREKYNKYTGYTIEPHLTLVYPFVPQGDIATVNEKLDVVAGRTRPFTLVLNGIEYFEEANNVVYAAIENKRPVVDLHVDIVHSLSGLITQEYTDGSYNLERFTPHVTIGEHIPDGVFPTVKEDFSDYELHHEIMIGFFVLFSAKDDRIWQPECVFKLRR